MPYQRPVHPNQDGTERYEKRFRVGGTGDLVSKYLNDLIKSLQAEAKEHEAAALKDEAAPTARGFRRDSSYLDRLHQRIKTLEELQLSEAKRHRQLFATVSRTDAGSNGAAQMTPSPSKSSPTTPAGTGIGSSEANAASIGPCSATIEAEVESRPTSGLRICLVRRSRGWDHTAPGPT